MPGGNGMGPWGMGPRTGRGLGFCAGYGVPGYMNRGFGAGFGGRRGGFGWRAGAFGAPGPFYGVPAGYGYAYQANPEMERDYLLKQTTMLKNQLSFIEKRLSELEAGGRETV